jgi:hypothetical protein
MAAIAVGILARRAVTAVPLGDTRYVDRIPIAENPISEVKMYPVAEFFRNDIAERVLEFFETIPARAKAKTAS